MEYNINRRKVLKSAVVSSSPLIVATQKARSASKQIGNARLIEVGLKYQLKNNHDYFTLHFEGLNGYWVDEHKEQINVEQALPEATREKFKSNDLIVGASDLFETPIQITGTQPVKGLPTKLRYGRIPSASVVLENPQRLPSITVQQKSEKPIINIEGQVVRSESGLKKEVELDPIRAVVQTEIATDEIVEVEGVPKDEWGPKIEHGRAEAIATPTVSIVDHGTLPVVEIN